MWCYKKPGFEALLLAELQRQQQCSQFCDTLLKTEGVSVPAHSCVLSAVSPNISSALSSTPPPPAGQSHLLEFQALGACTLLRVVRLLYSGEMAGEGEKEKQEAISAAAKLGIHGLVEVTRRELRSRREEGEGWHAEVGVQTEPLMPEENERRGGTWRTEVRDGGTLLRNETLSNGAMDSWTQTEELEGNSAPPPHPAVSFETIDVAALQSLGATDPNLLPPQIPFVPIPLIYPLNENRAHQLSSAPVYPMHESTAAGHTPVAVLAPPDISHPPSQATPCAADSQSWWPGYVGAARYEEGEDESFEQFQGNIPGYINYFLNPDKKGRPRGRRRAGTGNARRGGAGERRARRPQARTGGRARGRLTQTVDVQEVGVSTPQKSFLHRWGMRVSRTGQGGGAAGRRLYLKTRDLLKPTKSCQRGRVRSKVWEFSPSGEWLLHSKGGAGSSHRGRRNTTQQFNQLQDDHSVRRRQKGGAKPTPHICSSPATQFCNIHTLSGPFPQPSPSPGPLSPAASYVSPVSFLPHTTSAPPPAPPQHEERPDHIDRLLEEVMMGLDILPDNKSNNRAPHCQHLLPASSSTSCVHASSGDTLTQSKQQVQVVAVAKGAGSSSSASSEVAVLQQQGEGELNAMLEHFLLSFEQHIDSSTARVEVETGCTEAPVGSSRITEVRQKNKTRVRCSQASAPHKHTEGPAGKAPDKRRRKRKKNEYLFSLEKKKVRSKNPASSSNAKTKTVHDRADKQLQQMPVVKLERTGALPVRVTLQGHGCQSLEIKSSAKPKTSFSSGKDTHDSVSGKKTVQVKTKVYPIRSRYREAHQEIMPFLETPLIQKEKPSASQSCRSRGRPRKNGQLHSVSNCESSTPPTQTQPVEACGTEEQLEKNQKRQEQDLTVEPQEEGHGPTRRGKKRAEAEEETGDDVTVAKRVCFEQIPQPCAEPAGFEPAATETEDIIDVETVSLASVGDHSQREDREGKSLRSETGLREAEERLRDEGMESSCDEIIDVDGDVWQKDAEEDRRQNRTAPTLVDFVEVKRSVCLGSRGSSEEDKDEEIDVIGGSSPAPEPVIVSWMESSEGEKEDEDEDVDVVGEKTAVFATMCKSELISRKYQAELLLH